MSQKSNVMRHALDILLSGIIAFLLFGPITGAVLKGFNIQMHVDRPLMLAGLVMLGRLIVITLLSQPKTANWWARFYEKRHRPATVAAPNDKPPVLWLTLIALAGLAIPFGLSKYWLTVAILALIYVLLGLGLNIVVGLAGLLDLGFVAFYAVGAYGLALGAHYLDIGFWTALPFAAVTAMICGAILAFPVLRMHGDYLAIVTLGFGEIIRLVLNNWADFTGGPNGMSAPLPTLFGLEFTRRAKMGGTPFHEFFQIDYSSSYRYIFIYLTLFALTCLATFFVYRLKNMPLGRAWEALREDEIACRALGINHVTTKLLAFSLGAMVGSLGGVFFATYQGFVNPTSFTFIESALILSIVVLGGAGSITGVIIAALVLTLVPEVLREFANYRMLAFGGLMVLMMIIRPRGLIPIKRPFFRRAT